MIVSFTTMRAISVCESYVYPMQIKMNFRHEGLQMCMKVHFIVYLINEKKFHLLKNCCLKHNSDYPRHVATCILNSRYMKDK